jgi:hypothetical protein
MITKALIIDEPWINKILNGEKDWEMRSSGTTHRGLFGLIKKGSGKVFGVANLTGISGPYDSEGLAQNADHHRVDSQRYNDPAYKWRYAWELSNIQRLDTPVDYIHKSGAVIWVKLDQSAITKITRQINNGATNTNEPEREQLETSTTEEVGLESPSTTSIEIGLTQGNINNNHFYIPLATKIFPEDSWGGRNKSEAGKNVTVRFAGLDLEVLTDIDGTKRLFRSRGAVRQFYEHHRLKAQDTIKVSKVSGRNYMISPSKRSV